MASIRLVEPVVRFCALISQHDSACDWARNLLSSRWGEVILESAEMPFEASGYYTPTMGADLRKRLVAFEGFVDPAGLADWKHQTNEWEQQYVSTSSHAEPRPLNLDPGYVTQAKLVLATTKDRDHRIYLRDGMFAEVTLTYVGRRWQHHRWSYPSYCTEHVAAFADECRRRLRKHLRSTKQFRGIYSASDASTGGGNELNSGGIA